MTQGIKINLSQLTQKISVEKSEIIESTCKQALEDLKKREGIEELDFNKLEENGYEASIEFDSKSHILITISKSNEVIIQYKVIITTCIGKMIKICFTSEKVI